MSRKIKIISEKIVPKKISDSVFKATSTKEKINSDKVLIEQAIQDQKQYVEEQKVLAEELKKPISKRNDAIMRKYNSKNLDGKIDNYPDIEQGVKYNIIIKSPEDPSIPLEARGNPFFVGVQLEYNRNFYEFHFPFYRTDLPSAPYKIDYQETFLDLKYNVIEDISKPSLYSLLKKIKDGKQLSSVDVEGLKQFGMLKNDNNEFEYNFLIRGFGFLVMYTPINKKQVDKIKVTNPNIKQGVEELIAKTASVNLEEIEKNPLLKTFKKFNYSDYTINKTTFLTTTYNNVRGKISSYLSSNDHFIPGLKDKVFLPLDNNENPLVLTNIDTISDYKKPVFYIASFDDTTGEIIVKGVNGTNNVKRIFGEDADENSAVVKEYNLKKYNKYLEEYVSKKI